jgi:MFS family permease
MIALQSMMGVLALVLGLLTVTGAVQLWQVYLLAFLLGLNNTFENPARQAFMLEMVGPEHLRNAVTLNSVLVNAARAIGPAVAGVIIAVGGTGICFLLNAASFVAVVFSLVTLDVSRLQTTPPTARAKRQVREGLAYVARTPELGGSLLMMAIIGCFAYEFSVVLPVVAAQTFHGNASAYGFMTAAMGLGAVAGGLLVAARGRTGTGPLVLAAGAFAVAMGLATAAPTLGLELVSLALAGAASISFMSTGNSTLQLTAEPEMRGRVMSLWFVAFQGSTPVGGPVVGWVMEAFGPRAGLGLGAVTCLLAAIAGLVAFTQVAARRASALQTRAA